MRAEFFIEDLKESMLWKRRTLFKFVAFTGVSFLPLAKQLKYVHDAETSQAPSRKENAFCHNCRYFKGEQGAEWGGCEIFPNKAVNRQGWCNVWGPAQ